jgi:hypothetical protein
MPHPPAPKDHDEADEEEGEIREREEPNQASEVKVVAKQPVED